MKDHLNIGHLTKYDAFRVSRDQVMDFEIWFKIHTNVSNFETASPKTIYSCFEKGCPTTMPKDLMGNGSLCSLIDALGVSTT